MKKRLKERKNEYIDSVPQYLALIELLSELYPLDLISDNPVVEKFLFRGLADSKFKLTPGIYRETVTQLEKRSISNKTYTSYSDGISILQRFIQEASPFIKDIGDTDYLKWAMLAQHYGVPTRLLDWTANPLVALYFACVDMDDVDAAIWIYHANNYNRFLHADWNKGENKKTIGELASLLIQEDKNDILPKKPMILNPYYLDQRMAMQSSRFMVWGTEEASLDDVVTAEYYMEIPPEDQGWREYGDKQEKQFVFCVKIMADNKQHIVRQLESIGVSGKTIFPGLEGIGRFIERHYRFSYREAF